MQCVPRTAPLPTSFTIDSSIQMTMERYGHRFPSPDHRNAMAEIKEISAVSFATQSERLRINVLLALRGVRWPMASVILHFAFPDRYPIMDVRAMNTVGGSTHHTFEKWQEYGDLCRETAAARGGTMRELDKVLWVFDKGLQWRGIWSRRWPTLPLWRGWRASLWRLMTCGRSNFCATRASHAAAS